jgi:hypothetical protein
MSLGTAAASVALTFPAYAHALARIAPGGGTHEPSKDGWDAADAITEWDDVAALRRATFDCAKPFDAAESAPAYISFGRFTMDAHGLMLN